jgi:hydrogenase/urease accessory protein HupE
MMRACLFIAVAFWFCVSHTATLRAHELRPAFLEIEEAADGAYAILWKVPARGDMQLSLYVLLPDTCRDISPVTRESTGVASVSRWQVRCDGGLVGKTITIDGLAATYTDVLVRIARADGTTQAARLSPDSPTLEVTGTPSSFDTAAAYFRLGVEHIITGFDHLLFVLALLLLIANVRTLIETITSFTVAHSITLAFAALGYSRVPQPPVEALIALSIMFVAAEIIRKQRGRLDLASSYPWLIAFLFGLLHGFGFGGALREIGLPQKDVPLALFTFNLGVEAGQLMFIAVVLALAAALRLVVKTSSQRPRVAAAYAIGSISALWFVERLASFAV